MSTRKYAGPVILSMTPEQEADAEREREARQRRSTKLHLIAVDTWLEAYRASEIDLDALCHRVRDAAAAQGLSDKATEEWIGHVALRAMRCRQTCKPRKNGTATALKRVARELVEHASREWGAPKNRVGGKGGATTTAYQLAAEALADAGVKGVNARQVERWCEGYPASANVGGD